MLTLANKPSWGVYSLEGEGTLSKLQRILGTDRDITWGRYYLGGDVTSDNMVVGRNE